MGLHLLVQSDEDVPALSALVQDAAVWRADITYDPVARRLILLMARYCWEDKSPTRSRAALRIDHVFAVQQRGLDQPRVLDLLSITYDEPHMHLIFAGSAALRLQVETIDMTLDDFGEPWQAITTPKH
jgi:Protein of unknown function (DUF2948)